MVVLAGPTGIGKTAIGIELAKEFKSEIVSSDSRQVYQEMTIGTAVPSKEELESAKHYFIHTHSIHQRFNASTYEQEVMVKLEELFQTLDIVFLVGGSGMYIDALCYGIDDLPTITPEVRQKYEFIFQKEGIEKIRQLTQEIDPEYYKVVDVNNHKRMLKALEVYEMTGKTYSSQLKREKKKRSFQTVKLALDMPREELYERINQRVIAMKQMGLVEEARSLHKYKGLVPLKTVGYKELFEYFEGDISEDEAIVQIQNHSRAYARRQLTWFRRDNSYKWFLPTEISEMKNYIRESLNAGIPGNPT